MPKLTVVKVGGKLIEDAEQLSGFLDAFAALPGLKLLVHGGGRDATRFAERLNIPTQLINGRRITDAATLEVAVMVYAGLTNKRIVARLQARGVNALGLCGADGDVIRSALRPVKDINYGLVGDVERVDTSTLATLVTSGLTPVFSAITHDGEGQLLNTNADTIAARVAVAMSTLFDTSLRYCFEYPGVLYDLADPAHTFPEVSVINIENLCATGQISAGMLPKLDNAAYAKTHGVSHVSICGVDNLATQINATWIH